MKSNEKTNTGEGVKGKRGRTASDDSGVKSLIDTSTSARGQYVGESSTGAMSTVILGWALETCTENFPCHQRMPVSNLYASVHTSPTGAQRHGPSDVVEAASARVSRTD